MYEEFAFPPNYPALLHNEPPTDKLPREEEDLVSALPDQARTVEMMALAKVLSSASQTNKTLGEFDFQFQYDPPALKIEKQFKEELAEISKMIKKRNEDRDILFYYPYLDPENLPNYIPI